jgi:DNA-binding MarR family transcriptional regulator
MDKQAAIISLYLKSVNLFNEIEKKPKYYGTDQLLYNSEIDTLVLIGKNHEINLTDLAGLLGISKSGTSRFVKKLIEKGLIKKDKKPGNAKEVVFHLTSIGKIAFTEKEEFNKKLYTSLYSLIARYVEGDLNRIQEFLLETNSEMRKLL